MAKNNKHVMKKKMVKNTEDTHPEEEESRNSQEPGTVSRTNAGAGKKTQKSSSKDEGKSADESSADEKAS